MRIALISERWEARTDEGMLVFLDRLARKAREQHEVLVLHERGEGGGAVPTERVAMGKALVSAPLLGRLREFAPALAVYCPTACATVPALLRHRRLQSRLRVPCALLSLQSREYPAWARRIVLPRLRPWRLVVLSERAAADYRSMGFEVLSSRAGVDLERFRPASREERATLRSALGLPERSPIALHVGHLAAHRSLDELAGLAQTSGCAVVMVASAANAADDRLRSGLEAAGVVVRHGFVERIEDYYRAADVYVFPVRSGSGAIEFPLSVLEAMACDLPVATTRFGALPECFDEGDGLVYSSDAGDLASAVGRALASRVATRERVRPFGWDAVLDDLVGRLTEAAA